MPDEVISLLSSSPVGPSHTTDKTSLEPPAGNRSRVQREALDYGLPNEPSHIPAQPRAGTKRASSYQTRPYGRLDDEDDFLFLSDGFDTTGNLDASFHKKPRMSAGLLSRGKRDSGSISHSKSDVAKIEASHRQPSQLLVTRRFGHVADDIEFSSSPIRSTPLDASRKPPVLSSDPFASSQKETIPKPASPKPVPSSLFCSSPDDPHKDGRRLARARSAEPPRDKSIRDELESHRPSKATFIDLSSDPIDSPSLPKPRPSLSTTHRTAAWDPISSSAQTHDVQELLSSSPIGTRTRPYSDTRTTARGELSDSDELPDLDAVDFSKTRATKHSHSSSSRPTVRVSKRPMKVDGSAEEKEREKQHKIKVREAEKERKRIEMVHAREERALNKEKEKALAAVNKVRTDKKVSAPEMIVDIPASISPGLKVQIEALLGELNVQHHTWDSTVEHVVKWRRKVTSRFDEGMGIWQPTPLHIQDEKHVLVIVQAADFVRLVLADEGQDLEAHILRLKSRFLGLTLIYLIEGLTPWMRKNRNLLNRQFVSAVRSLGTNAELGSLSTQPRRRNHEEPKEYIDEDKIEDALLSLQVLHGTLVHHTNAPVETAQWVAVFTQHISTIPYRQARDASSDAGFCMESGQVRSGDGAKDTYIRMLQEIARITAPVAYGIATKYKSVTDLIRGLEEEGPLALADCRKSANKDGAITDRTIGQAISKRVHRIFLGQDPTSTDV
ncbi:ERCC4 domain-containing protein [Nemania sp. NC0429]|nr:ERCC4 domain-containing protein [Nemania sp. NC0429]